MKTSKISPMGFLHIIFITENLPGIIHFDEEADHLKGDSQIGFATGNVSLPFSHFYQTLTSCLETFLSKIDNQVRVDDDESATMLKNRG